MKSSSLKLVTNYGIPNPSEYRDSLIHSWYITEDMRKTNVTYFLAIVPTTTFFDLIHNGELTYQNKSYSVVWVSGPNAVRKTEKVLLSFRFCSLLNRGYVLVKAYKQCFKNDIQLLKYEDFCK